MTAAPAASRAHKRKKPSRASGARKRRTPLESRPGSIAGPSPAAAPAGHRKLEVVWRPRAQLIADARNARTHTPEQVGQIAASIAEFGFTNPVLIDEAGKIIAGHGRVLAAEIAGFLEVPTILLAGLTDLQKRAYAIADNKLALNAGWNELLLAREIAELGTAGFDVSLLGFAASEIEALLNPGAGGPSGGGNLAAKFGIAPFTVLNAREGWWQDRKAAWLALGIQSDLGRGETAHSFTSQDALNSLKAGKPHRKAGASAPASAGTIEDPAALTPVERHGDVWFKRDDLFAVGGVPGGKVRTCLALATAGLAAGKKGLVTAGSRASPQVNIVAHVAAKLGVPARCHTPTGQLSPEVQQAAAIGAEIVQHRAGYNNVIIARARQDAAVRGWVEIPFGMECWEAVTQTRRQVANLPAEVKTIVIPCGSGMSLAGVLHGLDDIGRADVRVRAVVVGADPVARLNEYAPGWRKRVDLVPSGSDYHDAAPVTVMAGVALDAHYEAKCIRFVKPGDMLWCVGIRATARPPTFRRRNATPGGSLMPGVDKRTGKIVRTDNRARPIPGTGAKGTPP
jgi:hypothetical protein